MGLIVNADGACTASSSTFRKKDGAEAGIGVSSANGAKSIDTHAEKYWPGLVHGADNTDTHDQPARIHVETQLPS
jgi:hypothetical protein